MSSLDHTFLAEAQEKLEAIQQVARAFLKREWSTQSVRALIGSEDGFSRELWGKMQGLGWPGILVPAELGGVDGSLAEFCGLAEELGRSLAAGPLVPTVVASQPVLLSGNRTLQEDVLPRAARGEIVLALAHGERELTTDPMAVGLTARPQGEGYRLDGAKLFVPCAHAADYLVTSARLPEGGTALFLVDAGAPGITRRALKMLDWSPYAEVVYEGVQVGPDRVIALGQEAESVLHETLLRRTLVGCAELLGVAEGALEMASEYAGNRVAFGRPIGAFQGVKHRLVNLRVNIEVARALCYGAAQDMAMDGPEREVSLAMAAFASIDGLRKVPEGALQAFGGIGFTWDHDIHLFVRRAATLSALLGDQAIYREKVAADLEARSG
jgi:alkylation response protein AidB-like acyl-CoA dehydrogenase